LQKFGERLPHKSGVYSFEQPSVDFDPASEKQFKAQASAWTFFQAQPPSYRKKIIWWVMSARLPATRAKRLASLLVVSDKQKRV